MLIMVCASPLPGDALAAALAKESNMVQVRVEVELDIFSGMPNPKWVLAEPDAEAFMALLAAAPETASGELLGNLGYRGFVVGVTRGTGAQLIRIQNGTIHLSNGTTDARAHDKNRELERWLLDTGKAHMKSELFQLVMREF